MLRDYDRKVMELISVDDFESHELAAQAEAPQEVTPASVTGFQVSSGQVA
jgi:hypothetical protein